MIGCVFLLALLGTHASAGGPSGQDQLSPQILVVMGAAGEEVYGSQFQEWAQRFQQTAKTASSPIITITPNDTPQKDRLRAAIRDAEAVDRDLWLILLGHGTFDGRHAKFNLKGPDIEAEELSSWLTPLTRQTVVLLGFSASGAFLPGLAHPDRIVVAATKNGFEDSFSRFGDGLSRAWQGLDADLDKDQQVSLLEAFLFASSRTEDFYRRAARLSTEHALLDDNGDGLGVPASWFEGVLATQQPKDGRPVDGATAHRLHLIPSPQERALTSEQKRERDALESRLKELRAKKGSMNEGDYYRELQAILIPLAELYEGVK